MAIETQLGNYEGGLSMRMLLGVDGSSYSDIATKTLEALRLPSPTEVRVMTVAPQTTFLGGGYSYVLRGADQLKTEA